MRMSEENGNDELKSLALKTFTKPFGAILELAPENGDAIWIDGNTSPPTILKKPPKKTPADCTWRGARESLLRALEGERAMSSAFVSGRVTLSGDMSVMARLQMEGAR